MTVSRQFFLLFSIPLLLISITALVLIFGLARYSDEASRLIQNLQHTVDLNQDLRRGVNTQTARLHEQFDSLDPLFPKKLADDDYLLGGLQTEYLKLEIGDHERLTVETIRSLESELGVQSVQIFEQLRMGRRAEATRRLRLVDRLEHRIEEEFGTLNEYQLIKIRSVLDGMNKSVARSYIAFYVLFSSLILILVAFVFLLKKRILLPLHLIFNASDCIRRGDLSARAPVLRGDEIGQLAQGFNFMAESLAESHAGLERKVEERTHQIQELQQKLIQTEKMSAVGRLVSGVAHELNNPLTAIIGFAELAGMDQDPKGVTPKGAKVMADIQSQAERCRRIVANLLQFARRQEPHLEAVRINELVERVLQLREYELDTGNITLVREYDPSNPLICADPNKIQQIALNLLNNAHDAIVETGRPGTIWVRTRMAGGKVILEFLDDGTGISKPECVFEPFYTTKEAGKGTGLGLSVCYGIVQEHHGEIRAANWERGALFTIILPRGDPEAMQAKQGPPDRPAPGAPLEGKSQALVVDDEEMLLRLQISYLSKMGMQGVGVSSGEEAVRYLKEHSVDVVISDIRMPGTVDGIRLFHWIRKNRPALLKRFLLVSGAMMAAEESQDPVESTVPRIQKPFRFDDYSRTIRQVLQT